MIKKYSINNKRQCYIIFYIILKNLTREWDKLKSPEHKA